MASWVTHLWVADEVLKRFPELDNTNDAKEEMIRMEELNRARDEMKKEGKVKPVSQKMFRVV